MLFVSQILSSGLSQLCIVFTALLVPESRNTNGENLVVLHQSRSIPKKDCSEYLRLSCTTTYRKPREKLGNRTSSSQKYMEIFSPRRSSVTLAKSRCKTFANWRALLSAVWSESQILRVNIMWDRTRGLTNVGWSGLRKEPNAVPTMHVERFYGIHLLGPAWQTVGTFVREGVFSAVSIVFGFENSITIVLYLWPRISVLIHRLLNNNQILCSHSSEIVKRSPLHQPSANQDVSKYQSDRPMCTSHVHLNGILVRPRQNCLDATGSNQ
jgi:hypothetical protein